jgi:valyl-tRNA synthetase
VPFFVRAASEGGRFDDAASTLYRFVTVFCDWYLELANRCSTAA